MHAPRLAPIALPVLAAALAACAGREKTPVASSGDLPPDAVVATYAGGKITAGQMDAEITNELAQLEQQKYEARKQALERMITQALVREQAAREKVTEDEWLRSQIDAQMPPPSEEEVRRTFEQSRPQLGPDAKFEDFADRIAQYLQRAQKQERANKIFQALRAAANVQIALAEPAKARKNVEAKGPSRGPADAKVTIVEFSDFECPFCSRAHDTVEEMMKAYEGKVRLVFRHYPLPFHQKAGKAAEASLCAHDQGKFWQYHDALFQNQDKLDVPNLQQHAAALGLDTQKFNACLESGQHKATVEADAADGAKVGVSGTPAFFINGVMLAGALPLDEFRKVIDAELAGAPAAAR